MPRKPRELTPDRSARHLFGAELRRHRVRAGMSLEELAEIVNYSRSHLSRIEIAEHMPPPDLPARLDAAFGTDRLFERLYGLARNEAHPDKYRRQVELEARARVIAEYAGHFVPGLVQTENYARTLFRISKPHATDAEIEELVSLRLGRQALLRGEPRPHLSLIIDEAVIRRPIGSHQIWRTQLSALTSLVDTPASIVQVLPFAHGGHALMGGALSLFTLDDGTTVAYEESITTGELLEDPVRVHRHQRAYDLCRAYALSPSDTAAFISTVMEELPS
ncbi:helix-turn-helix domain-containing protein [Streptomyces sp. AV19]|uniref:helix-turn-helix domain-containing protein n=1 Tax=Streptomyces sp. AV19 TaxID=2793068 RepID=UPI0018FE0420|nr:helix-turn-helix transcriptional regulator [Streptomyces sp. AV19]MBH1933009.1 helix-turn-helix domain-containing protein [Streptomyces sp. AV19]MDG4531721.1 helix-turn-helix transcriptional regulator [Streptomyces sp. AV19]